jgi:dihydrofolate reductase
MRKICYRVAMSLDGYIAGPNGEYDWIVAEPEIDFAAEFARFDTALVGRRTFETMVRVGRTEIPGLRVLVFSRTLRQSDYPNVTISADADATMLAALRSQSGKDILLFGGADFFHSLLQDSLVDAVEVSIISVLLGGGIPILPSPAARMKLELTGQKTYKSDVVALWYEGRMIADLPESPF